MAGWIAPSAAAAALVTKLSTPANISGAVRGSSAPVASPACSLPPPSASMASAAMAATAAWA
eukprot:scaffold32277_cov108-Isochrysis_galbana.AAC.9